jgi:hypothetical protein
MRHIHFLFGIIACALMSCSHQPTEDHQSGYGKPIFYGKHITEEGAIDCSELKDKMGDSTVLQTKIKGEVVEICPDKTCILQLDMGDGTCMNVKMNNAQITLPKDLNGKTAIVEGRVYVDTTNVKMIPGYVRDSGSTEAETEVTKDPELSLAFDATGLIIK